MSEEKDQIADQVIAEIKNRHLRMKPRWYFALGSIAWVVGLASLAIFSIFLINLATFSLRTHGPMGDLRFDQMVANFPWWTLLLSTLGIIAGIWLIKQHDISYRYRPIYVILTFILAIFLAGFLINYLDLDRFLMGRGPFKEIYRQYDGGYQPHGPGWGRKYLDTKI